MGEGWMRSLSSRAVQYSYYGSKARRVGALSSSSFVNRGSRAASRKGMTWDQKVLFTRRVSTYVGGTLFVLQCYEASILGFIILYGASLHIGDVTLDNLSTMREWIGTTTLRKSPLIVQALQDQTTPRSEVLYLELDGSASFKPCAGFSPFNADLYSHDFQTSLYAAVVAGAAYNLTFLSHNELILPVVDCAADSIEHNDISRAKFFYLVRTLRDPDDVYLLTLAMSNQEYWVPAETQTGLAAVSSLTLINDLTTDHVDHHFVVSLNYPLQDFAFQAFEYVSRTASGLVTLRNIPPDPTRELTKTYQTTRRVGFFQSSERTHSNIKSEYWVHASSPVDTIVEWTWKARGMSRDAYAWSHILDLGIGLVSVGHLSMMFVILYRTLLAGRRWAPDPCVPVSTLLHIRGIAVYLIWHLTNYWALVEFCLHEAYELSGLDPIAIYQGTVRMDYVSMYMSVCGILGILARDRVDPPSSHLVTLMLFTFRRSIIHHSPTLVAKIKRLTMEFRQEHSFRSSLSPMGYSAPFEITKRPTELITLLMIPLALLLPYLIMYVVLRKTYKHIYPPHTALVVASKRGSVASGGRNHDLKVKSSLTVFEIATGAQLENNYGYLSDYENHVFIKGMKYAAADGVYTCGFVIVNHKYVVNADDVFLILLMKLLRRRYTKVYVFELKSTTVQQTARLVYPDMFEMRDFLNITVDVLS